MAPILIYGLVFVSVLLVVDTVTRGILNSRRSREDVRNRLASLKTGNASEEQVYTDFLRRRGLASDGPTLFTFGWFSRLYAQSGIEMPLGRRIAFVALFIMIGWFIGALFFSGSVALQLLFAVVFGTFMVLAIVFIKRRRRIRKFVTQLAPAIETIVRSIRAGHPVPAAISLVAREMPDPIGSEFGVLSDQLTFGSELEDALLNMIERVGAEELNLLTVTMTVQRGTGGNLAEILENLAQMIRDRLLLKSKIRAISAEGRFTSWIMILFPFFLFSMIRLLVPDYYDDLIDTGYANIIVVVCFIMVAFGAIVLNRMVNFDF